MKKLIAEICKREGKKSVSSKANVSEIMRCLAEILTAETLKDGSEAAFTLEFLNYLEAKAKPIFKKSKRDLKAIMIDYRFEHIETPPKPVKKKARKNA